MTVLISSFFFFFNDTATTEIYTLSLHDALPILNKTTLRASNRHGLGFWLILNLLASAPTLCLAHSQLVHMLISSNAAPSSDGLKAFLTDYFGAQNAAPLDSPALWLYGFPGRGANTTYTPLEWILCAAMTKMS